MKKINIPNLTLSLYTPIAIFSTQTSRASMSSLLFYLLLIIGLFVISAFSEPASNSMRYELIHRHVPHLPTHVQEIVRKDNLRSQMISKTLSRRRMESETSGESSFEIPISSGAYSGTGQYFVRFRVGTPEQKFLLVADTGSDLTWMNCRRYRCRDCRHSGRPHPKSRRRRVFYADISSSFSPITCSAEVCKTLPLSLVTCPTPASPCAYDFGYSDGSTTQGIYANESASITLENGRRTKLKGIVVGCSSAFVGSSFREADGVLGLGHSNYSFAVQAISKFGGKFSYCLVDHLSPKNASSYLVFGGGLGEKSSQHCKQTMRYTKLVMDPILEPFYAVEIIGVSVGGNMLAIPKSVWNVSFNSGVILDSGTSLTMLAEPAYRAVFSALSVSLLRFKKVDVKPFEFCFNSTMGFEEGLVPRLVVHLSGSARLEPPVKSYVIDVADGVKCIGLLSAPWPGMSTIGNIMQQNHMWEFDIAKGRLGFEPSTCV